MSGPHAAPRRLRACSKVVREEPDVQGRERSSLADQATRAAAGAGERGPLKRGGVGGGAAGRSPLLKRLRRRDAGSARCAAGTSANHRAPPPITGRLAWLPRIALWCGGAEERREGGSYPPTSKFPSGVGPGPAHPSWPRPRPAPPRPQGVQSQREAPCLSIVRRWLDRWTRLRPPFTHHSGPKIPKFRFIIIAMQY